MSIGNPAGFTKGYTMSTFKTYSEIVKEVRGFYREYYKMSEPGLPCLHCIFEEEPDTECGYVWITCTADSSDGDGCNWGNI